MRYLYLILILFAACVLSYALSFADSVIDKQIEALNVGSLEETFLRVMFGAWFVGVVLIFQRAVAVSKEMANGEW